MVQFLCRAGEPVVVSSPRSFSGATETRVSKAPVKSSQAEDVLFRKVCTTRQCLGCNTHSTCSHPRSWTFVQDYTAEVRASRREWAACSSCIRLKGTSVLLLLSIQIGKLMFSYKFKAFDFQFPTNSVATALDVPGSGNTIFSLCSH